MVLNQRREYLKPFIMGRSNRLGEKYKRRIAFFKASNTRIFVTISMGCFTMKICNASPSIEEKWKNAESGIIDMIAWKSISNGPSLPVYCLPKDTFEEIWPSGPCPQEYLRTIERLHLQKWDFEILDYCEPFIVFISDIEYYDRGIGGKDYRQFAKNKRYLPSPGIYVKGKLDDYSSGHSRWNLEFGIRFTQIQATNYYSLPRKELVENYCGSHPEMNFVYSLATLQTFWGRELSELVKNTRLAGFWSLPIMIYKALCYRAGLPAGDLVAKRSNRAKKVWDALPRKIFIEQTPGWYDDLIDEIRRIIH